MRDFARLCETVQDSARLRESTRNRRSCETVRDCTRLCKTVRDCARVRETGDRARRCETVRDSTRACKSMRDLARIQRQLITQQAAGDVNFLVRKTDRHVTL